MEQPNSKNEEITVEILRCAKHDYYAVTVNDRRITSSKCCGSWETVRRYTLSGHDKKYLFDVLIADQKSDEP